MFSGSLSISINHLILSTMTFQPDIQLNNAAVIIASVLYYFIGFLWYSVFFRKTWIAETNVVHPDDKRPMGIPLGGQFLSTMLYTYGLAILFSALGATDVMSCIIIGLVFSLLIIIPMNSGTFFFQNKMKLFLIDVSERIVGTLMIAILLGLWQ